MRLIISVFIQAFAMSAWAAPHNPLTQDTTAHVMDGVNAGTTTCVAHAGVVPVTTAADAVARARAAWQSIREKGGGNADNSGFSAESIARVEPYTATLKDGEWQVRGTLPPGYAGTVLETTVGACDGSITVNGAARP
jgi:hypothetical protein